MELTARWNPKNYTISYNNTKDAANTNLLEYTIEDEFDLTPLTDVIGYNFIGWKDSAGNVLTAIDLGRFGNLQLRAEWEAKKYTINYTVAGATNPQSNPTIYTIESPDLPLADAVGGEDEFLGWSLDGNIITHIPTGSHGNITLVAEFAIRDNYQSGDGSVSDPYIIVSKGQLIYFANQINSGVSSTDTYFALGRDISLGGDEWTPIGSASIPFEGIFDGNDFKISNFEITSDLLHVGLFGVNAGTIQGLGVENFQINAEFTNSSSVGGLVGYNRFEVINCHAIGNIIASTTLDGLFLSVGGLIGKSSDTSTAEYCNAKVDISVTSEYDITAYTGGLMGYANLFSNISKSYATGIISATGYAGGLIGRIIGNTVSVSDCYATGNVTAKSSAGGLIGASSGVITNCYATGLVAAIPSDSDGAAYAGGLVAENFGSVTNSYATGNVIAESERSLSDAYAGGLVAYNDGTIETCFRYSGQTITRTYQSETATDATDTSGESTISLLFTAPSFYTALGWSNEVWNFSGTLSYSKGPTLKLNA